MISKKSRLTEREVKKVLGRWKPFFAYWIVLNKIPNREWKNRFAIVIGWKSVNTNVTRTFFRRKFYDYISWTTLFTGSVEKTTDFVFVVKKKTQLDRKSLEALKTFEKDLNFLVKKVK